MELSLTKPDEGVVVTAASFITSEAHGIHNGLGGSSKFDLQRAKFVQPRPYERLEKMLKNLDPKITGVELQENTRDGVYKMIDLAERRYSDSKDGFWHSIWYKMGGYRDTLDGWVALIPDDYGLAVVKAGVVVMFMLAEDSTERYRKVRETFALLRDVLNQANPTQMSFRAHEEVGKCLDCLYQTVLDVIQEMILLTSKETPKRRTFRIGHNTPCPDPEPILQRLTDCTKTFERALSVARDKTIESTAVVTGSTEANTRVVRSVVNATKQKTNTIMSIAEENSRKLEDLPDRVVDRMIAALGKKNKIAVRENKIQCCQLDARNELLDILCEVVKQKNAEISRLHRQISYPRTHGAVVDLNWFCEMLFSPSSAGGRPLDLVCMFDHPTEDFERALVQRGRFKAAALGQVQSLLRRDRFLQWINLQHSDLIMVNANIHSAALEKLSAMSVFCATLVTSLMNVQPHEVVAHFFCGLHTAFRDTWYGPNGLVRSLILQLSMKLAEMHMLSLDFIDNRDDLLALEEHDLQGLCATLHALLSQFPADTTVYCMLDGISCFDIDKTFEDLQFVMEFLQYIVDDPELRPVFKVLLTNPMNSTRRMKALSMFKDSPERMINLSSNNLTLMGLSPKVVESQILRPLTPTPPMPRRELSSNLGRGYLRSKGRAGCEVEREDRYYKGWQSE